MMKHRQKKRLSQFFVLILSILLVMSLSGVATFAGEELPDEVLSAEEEPIPEETEEVSGQSVILADEPQITTWEELRTALSQGGTVTLTQDLAATEFDADLTISKDVTLDLNGHVLDGHNPNPDYRDKITSVNSGGQLTIMDSDPSRVHSFLTYQDPLDETETCAITGGTIDHCQIQASGGRVIMNGGTLTGCSYTSIGYSGAITISSNGTFEMNGGTIAGNTIAVYVDEKCSFVMNGGTITGNRAGGKLIEDDDGTWRGSAVVAVCGGKFTMQDGTITRNSGETDAQAYNQVEYSTGGVFITRGIFNMKNGVISNNASDCGGSVLCDENSTFNMLGGEISGNRAAFGGGVYSRAGNVYIKGGSIRNNTAAKSGGGIYFGRGYVSLHIDTDQGQPLDDPLISPITQPGEIHITTPKEEKLYLSGGSITGNKAGIDGGGIFLHSLTQFEMSGSASITRNTAGNDGGGIYVVHGTVEIPEGRYDMFGLQDFNIPVYLDLKGGIISGNVAGKNGGGIYLSQIFNETTENNGITQYYPQGTFNLSGKITISGNKGGSPSQTKDDLYLTEALLATITGDLKGSCIGVKTSVPLAEDDPLVFTSGLAGNGRASNFVSDDPTYAVTLSPDNEAMLAPSTPKTAPEIDLQSLKLTIPEGRKKAFIGDAITLSAEATDEIGVDALTFYFVNSDGSETWPVAASYAGQDEETHNGLWEAKETIDNENFTGDWKAFLIQVQDVKGNASWYWDPAASPLQYDGDPEADLSVLKFAVMQPCAAHNWEEQIEKATPTTDGKIYQTCSECGKEEAGAPLLKVSKISLAETSYTYTGKAITPKVTVANAGETLSADCYEVAYSNNINAGTATAKVTLKGKYYEGSKNLTFKINQAANSITRAVLKKSYKAKKMKKKQSFKIGAVANGKAKISYKATVPKAVKKYIKMSKTGKVTVKKGLAKGTYKIPIKITATATKNYKATTVKKTVKIVVK